MSIGIKLGIFSELDAAAAEAGGGDAIELVGYAAGKKSSGTWWSNPTPTMDDEPPDGMQQNDLIIFTWMWPMWTDPGTPSGYTQLLHTIGPSSLQFRTTYKVVGASVDTSFPTPTEGYHHFFVSVWRNVDTSNPFDATPTVATGYNTNANPASITTQTDNAVVLVLAGRTWGWHSAWTGWPSGYPADNRAESGRDGWTGAALTWKTIESAGTEDPGTFTHASYFWITQTIALRQA